MGQRYYRFTCEIPLTLSTTYLRCSFVIEVTFNCSVNNVASTWLVFPNKEQNIVSVEE